MAFSAVNQVSNCDYHLPTDQSLRHNGLTMLSTTMPKGKDADGDPDEGIGRTEYTRESGQKIRSSQPVRGRSAHALASLGFETICTRKAAGKETYWATLPKRWAGINSGSSVRNLGPIALSSSPDPTVHCQGQ